MARAAGVAEGFDFDVYVGIIARFGGTGQLPDSLVKFFAAFAKSSDFSQIAVWLWFSRSCSPWEIALTIFSAEPMMSLAFASMVACPWFRLRLDRFSSGAIDLSWRLLFLGYNIGLSEYLCRNE